MGQLQYRNNSIVYKMEQYANFGFDFMQEKLEENPNYFFKETAFLRRYLPESAHPDFSVAPPL